jgi:hypothetical protein
MSKIHGISIALHDRCRNCASDIAIVGDAPPPYFTQLRCDSCDCARGYVGDDLYAFLEEFVDRFGTQPTQPIVLLAGELREPERSERVVSLRDPGMARSPVAVRPQRSRLAPLSETTS